MSGVAQREAGDMLVCGCGDPTCIRGAIPWEPCHNPDQLIDRSLANVRRRARASKRADVRSATVFRASELVRRG